jgi:hypothetical protein
MAQVTLREHAIDAHEFVQETVVCLQSLQEREKINGWKFNLVDLGRAQRKKKAEDKETSANREFEL